MPENPALKKKKKLYNLPLQTAQELKKRTPALDFELLGTVLVLLVLEYHILGSLLRVDLPYRGMRIGPPPVGIEDNL